MRWIEPKYGRKAVRRAGEILADDHIDLKEVVRSYGILSNWRSAHAYPIRAILMLVRGWATKIDRNPLIVQRLKRTPSILAKLRREHGMKLERMEDIGGCRAVVATSRHARRLAAALMHSRTRHVLHRERDYIARPKKSGYRGIHLVYRYGGAKEIYRGIPVEVQIRSKIQHSWATAVEVAGAFTKYALKASQGPNEWLDYFRYASAELAKLESCTVDPELADIDTAQELERLSSRLNVRYRLRAFAVTTQNLGKRTQSKNDFFLLTLDIAQSMVRVKRFGVDQFGAATKEYAGLERQFRNDELRDVVLVSASSINALKKGYPNYFADTTSFVEYLDRARKANSSIQRMRYARS